MTVSLSTYSGLKSGIALWQHKVQASFTDRADDFIALFEAGANAEIRLRENEVETSLTATASSSFINLPSNFVEHVWLKRTSTMEKLLYVVPDQLPYYAASAASTRWTIKDSRIQTERDADQAYAYTFRYHKKYDIATDTTNSLLTRYPNVYLYGCLLEAAPFVQDADTLALWQTRYERAHGLMAHAEARYKALGTLSVDPSLIGAGRFDINTGV